MRRGAIMVLVFALSACGHARPPISSAASQTLQAKVAAIRAAASAHDAAAVTAELAGLRAQVTELRGNGQLSASAAQRILTAASAVDHNLPLITTTTTTTPPDPGQGQGNDHGDQGGD